MPAPIVPRASKPQSDAPRGASLLPRNVRLVGGAAQAGDGLDDGLLEFEVLKGNAAYGEGERFFLTPAQARRANLTPPRAA